MDYNKLCKDPALNNKIRGYLYNNFIEDSEAIKEIVQSTWIKAFELKDSFRGGCKFITWLCKISQHQYYRYRDHYRRYVPTDFEIEITEEFAPYIAEYNEMSITEFSYQYNDHHFTELDDINNRDRQQQLEYVKASINSLQPKSKAIIYDNYINGLSIKELSDKYGIKETGVETCLRKNIKRIKKAYDMGIKIEDFKEGVSYIKLTAEKRGRSEETKLKTSISLKKHYSKYNPKKTDWLKALTKNNCCIADTERETGIVKQNYYRWLKADPEFKFKADYILNHCKDNHFVYALAG